MCCSRTASFTSSTQYCCQCNAANAGRVWSGGVGKPKPTPVELRPEALATTPLSPRPPGERVGRREHPWYGKPTFPPPDNPEDAKPLPIVGRPKQLTHL